MVLALFEHLNSQLIDRQSTLFHDSTLTLSEQWDRACDYLDEDIASGYVRVLQELIAASWADAPVAKGIQAGLLEWFRLLAELARRAERELGGLGPFTAEDVAALVSNAFVGAESYYLLGLEKKGVLFASGPLAEADGKTRGDGLTILRAASAEDARRIAEADPFVVAGLRNFELREWTVMEGSLGIKVNFSDQSFELA